MNPSLVKESAVWRVGWMLATVVWLVTAKPDAVAAPLGPDPRVVEVVAYRGPDRAERLVAGARTENQLTLYTALTLREAEPLVASFKQWLGRRYDLRPEIVLWRANAEDVLQRIVLEARAGRHQFDVYEGSVTQAEIAKREGLTVPFWSPHFEDYPAVLRDQDGYWHATRHTVITQAYNIQLVKEADLPKTWSDLLDSRWKGRLAIEASDWDWFATLVRRGPFGSPQAAIDYFTRLRAQSQIRSGHTLMAELLAAGEFAIAVTAYNHHAETMKQGGAPVEWYVIPPAVVRANGVSVAARAPHPHLSVLFVDYLLSEEGQRRILELGRVPAGPHMNTRLNQGFDFVLADLQAVIDEATYWQQVWERQILGS